MAVQPDDELMLRIQQPVDEGDGNNCIPVQATFCAAPGLIETNMDVRAPDCIKRLHEAAIRIVYEHRLEREKVEEILKIIKDAMAGILPSENRDITLSESIQHLCECLCDCLDQEIEDAANPNLCENTSRYIEELGLKIEKIVVGCIAVWLKFDSNMEKSEFIRSELLQGKFVSKIQAHILSEHFREKIITLNRESKSPGSLEYLTSTEKIHVEKFLESLFKNLVVSVWLNIREVLNNHNAEVPVLLKLQIRAPSYPAKLQQNPHPSSLISSEAVTEITLKIIQAQHMRPSISLQDSPTTQGAQTNAYRDVGQGLAQIHDGQDDSVGLRSRTLYSLVGSFITKKFTARDSVHLCRRMLTHFMEKVERNTPHKDIAVTVLDVVTHAIPASAGGMTNRVGDSPNRKQAVLRAVMLFLIMHTTSEIVTKVSLVDLVGRMLHVGNSNIP